VVSHACAVLERLSAPPRLRTDNNFTVFSAHEYHPTEDESQPVWAHLLSSAMARILLIEDNDALRTMLAEVLALAGHTVVEAGNGRNGLDLFRQAGADLVITDLVMPEIEGLEVVRQLRNAHAPVNVIAISGGGRAPAAVYLEAARLLGAARVLHKPFTTAVLLAAIDELLSGDR
jgi:DNA-binding response OmpR family regulator